MTRREARELAFSLLYELTFFPEKDPEELYRSEREVRPFEEDDYVKTVVVGAAKSKEQIDALDEFDWTEFRADCVYQVHTQPLEIASEPDFDEDKNPLYKKFGDVLSVELKVTFRDKYAWLDEISSPELIGKLLSLAPEDLELLDAYVFGDKTQVELAKEKGISQKNISKKLNRIRRFLAGN